MTHRGWIAVVGDTAGFRRDLRALIASVYKHPASRIEFIQCPDHLAETHIAARNLHRSYERVLTMLDIDDLYDRYYWHQT
jgi:hypothetical protein